MLTPCIIHCPYCGERLELLLDASAGAQEYIEDCQVCCQPIRLQIDLDDDDTPHVRAFRQDDA